MDVNGQFVDTIQIVPLVVMDTRKVASTVKKYFPAGRQIKVDAYYSSWGENNENHGFVVTNILLGDNPYVPKEAAAGGGDAGPSLPV